MISVFTEHITERLIFVLDFCFKEKGIDYAIQTSKDDWLNSEGEKFNYANQIVEQVCNITPQGILFENDIYQSKKIEFNNGKYLIDGVEDQLGFIFYLLTSYSAYYSQEVDKHDRINSSANVLVKLGHQKNAVADRLVMQIWEALKLDYSKVVKGFKFIPSFDIDIAWAYKNRSLYRTLGGIAKGTNFVERISVLLGAKKDPYDTFEYILSLSQDLQQINTFILVGDWDKYDKNIQHENKNYRTLIKRIHKTCKVGIHPSYASYLNVEKIRAEKNRLRSIVNEEIYSSRQHFLRLKIPQSYQALLQAGITEDFSMGFADNIGFRTGTSFPYYFFDLTTNTKTDLMIHPFMYMDSALKDYLKLNIENATEEVNELIKETKAVGGTFMCIWHNSSIHNLRDWKGWRAVLDQTVANCK